jgi:A/G-specific adenine glycosylase
MPLVDQRAGHVKHANALFAWSEIALRNLAWRKTRDPWAILVSEVMLQQTQVARVLPRFEPFLERFPTPAACAAAGPAAVVRAWAGLGYNRRAVGLWRTASAVVERHGGGVPDSLADLLALPGVGPYTARAVLAFAFERDVGVLDANARRVVSRLLGRGAKQAEADGLVPAGAGWLWNQAVLDLGAAICRPRPRCSECPLSGSCAWYRAGGPDPWRPGPRQAVFAGSEREGRGRLVTALRHGPVPMNGLATSAGWPSDPGRAERVAAALVAEGLAEVRDDRLVLAD